ncbi:MAG: hypothetical protein V1742_03635 [Pseudomonadota bacterium]
MKAKFLTLRLILVFILGVISASCGTISREYPPKHFYALDVSRPADAAVKKSGPILRIRTFRVSPGFEDKYFVYRSGDSSYESDFYNEFFVPPGAMLTENIRQWLSATGLFQYVLDAPSHVLPDFILEGAVTALYGDFRDLKNPLAVMELQFFLVHNQRSGSPIAFQKNYRLEIPLKGQTPADLVQGWNMALRRILSRLEDDLRGIDLNPKG